MNRPPCEVCDGLNTFYSADACDDLRHLHWTIDMLITSEKSLRCQCEFVDPKYSTAIGESYWARNSYEYGCWVEMRRRCRSTSRHAIDYHNRGILVCSQWSSFSVFLEDMSTHPGKGMSLDRIDNNKGYCPHNCRWSDIVTQNKNRRGWSVK